MKAVSCCLAASVLALAGQAYGGNVTIAVGKGSVAVNENGTVRGSSTGTRGSGMLRNDPRNLAAFSAIEVAGSVDVQISCGGAQSVVVRADDNLLRQVRTEVAGGRLKVSLEGSLSTQNPLEVQVSVPNLSALTVSGSGDATVSRLNAGAFRLVVSGSGDVKISGNADTADISIAGSGNLDGKKLNVKRASVEIRGSGDAALTVLDSLKARISGSGDLDYYGNPRHVEEQISGSGDLNRH